MTMTRRELLAAGAAAIPAVRALGMDEKEPQDRKRMGVVIHTYGIRLAADRAAGGPGLADPLAFVEHCHNLGAGGVQTSIGTRDKEYVAKLRGKLEEYRMYLEGSVRAPQDKDDVERFTNEVRTAKDAGAKVVRTVLSTGRRYEVFDSAEAYRKAADRAALWLSLAEPVVAKLDMRLAVENHKDFLVEDLLGMLKRLDSKHVGVCVDTGNSIALLEEPLEVVETYAPWAFSVHLKDMGVAEYDEGFLLSEMPLGDGFLDLKKIVRALRKAHPEVQFNLEMITRDPLKVPCLTPKYWATFESLPGRFLARTLTMIRKHKPSQPLPRVSGLAKEQQPAAEESNVQQCFAYARKELDL
jgi:sugar phosphate isomerase/epimerase